MLVFGDHAREVAPQELIRALERRLCSAAGATGIAERDRLTAALILAGELLQGVADAEHEAAGEDDCTPAAAALMELAIAVAGCLLAANGTPVSSPKSVEASLITARRLALPPRIRCKTPEGYSFYAVYPEDYAAAAARAVEGCALIVGLRSIGTSLAAAAAARLGCPAFTVRPCGHPFRRELRVSSALRERLTRHPGDFVVVDEGPGLSGSSFGAVGDLLESLGVPAERIVFLPSHAGNPGAVAFPRHRTRWQRARRTVAASGVSPSTIEAWFDDLVGPVQRVEELSCGAWREDLAEQTRPPVAPGHERRKFRLTGPRGRWLARFAGLGEIGEGKLRVARALHAAGFVPEPLAMRRGFLLERWVAGAPLQPAGWQAPRFLDTLARYLGHRVRDLPPASEGARYAELRTMAEVNAAELGGPGLGRRVAARLPEDLAGLAPVLVDGRMHAWEWLRLPGGGFCKTDALDHASAHDLVGCQDIAWDVAGAAVEFALPERSVAALTAAVGAASGHAVDPAAVGAFRICYAAFQAGSWRMIGEPGRPVAALERRYLAELRRALATPAHRRPAIAVGNPGRRAAVLQGERKEPLAP